jgi:hypothetical protein
MSFQSDLIGVLKAEIGLSASLFYKKCMLHLKKDPSFITQSDLEEIAEWAYEEIRSMIDEKTALRVRHMIIQIPVTADVAKRPFSPHSASKRPEESAPIEKEKIRESIKEPVPVPVPQRSEGPVQEPGFSSLVSKSLTDLQKKNSMAASPVPAAAPAKVEESRVEHDISGLVSKSLTDLKKKKNIALSPAPSPAPVKVEDTRPEPGFSGPENKSLTDAENKDRAAPDPEQESSVDFFVSDSKTQPESFTGSIEDLMEDAGPEPEEPVTNDRTGVKPVTLVNQLDDYLSKAGTDSEDTGLWSEIADLYLKSGKFREAVQAHRRVIGLGGETAAIWNSLGDSYKKTGQYEDSDAAYARSLELDPDDPVIWLKRAKVQASRNRYNDALDSCDRSLTLDDSSAAAWNYKAFILKKVGRNEEALEIYPYLRKLDPADENAARQEVTIRKLLQKLTCIFQVILFQQEMTGKGKN